MRGSSKNALLSCFLSRFRVIYIIYIYYIPPPLTVHFPMMRSVRYQPGLKFKLHRARVLNNVVITTIKEMVEMVEILDGRVGKRSVERVRYVINNLLHLVIVKYGVISLVLCIFTCLRIVTMLTLLMKYLVIFHTDPCNKSYICVCRGPKSVGGIMWPKRVHAQSQYWAVKSDQ